jgi:protein SCO1/2
MKKAAFASLVVLGCVGTPALLAGPCCPAPVAPAEESGGPPDASLYHLDATWHDQDGVAVKLADLSGSPVIMTMVFTNCAFACPRIVADLRAIQDALPADVRAKARFVLASFDTARDTPERLREWAAENRFGPEWTLLHGDADAVRELSVLLDIAYLPQPDGSFAHGNRIVLLDARGVPAAAVEGLGAKPDTIAHATTALVRNPTGPIAAR